MWKKIIDLKYLTVAKYYFLGIVLAAIIFQFATRSIHNAKLDFSSLIDIELLVYIISALLGALVGGIVFLSILIYRKDREFNDKSLYIYIKQKNSPFFIRNMLAFSLGGFIYMFLRNLIDLSSYDHLIQKLFSKDLVIEYIGMILAMTVFSILLSIGIKKRLNLLYDKQIVI